MEFTFEQAADSSTDEGRRTIASRLRARALDAGLCGAIHPRNLWVCNNFRDHDDNHKVIPQGAFGAAILDAKPTHEWARLVSL